MLSTRAIILRRLQVESSRLHGALDSLPDNQLGLLNEQNSFQLVPATLVSNRVSYCYVPLMPAYLRACDGFFIKWYFA